MAVKTGSNRAERRRAAAETSAASDTNGARGTFSAGKRWKTRTLSLVGIALAVYCVIAANAINFRHPWRIDLTEEQRFSLSEETKAVLGLVTQDIEVVLPLYVQQKNPVQMAHARVLARAHSLLREYAIEQPRLRVVTDAVNVLAEPARWEQLCKQYDFHPTSVNRLIFLMGEGGNYRQSVLPEDLAALRSDPSQPGVPPQVTRFRGEKALTEAISRLVHQRLRKVYFTKGHRELAPRPGAGQAAGMAALVHDLEASGFEVPERPLDLSRVERVPPDCELLIIAGPEQEFTRDELDVLQDYLLRDGRLFVALGSRRTGLEGLLENWGIRVLGGSIRAKGSLGESRYETSWVTARGLNLAHPITAPFAEIADRFEVRLLSPRALEPIGASRRLMSDRLLSTAASTPEETYFQVGGLGTGGGLESDGIYDLAAATRQQVLETPPEGWQPLATRLVVVGSASFLRDVQEAGSARGSFRSGSHRDLFMNCVNWLVGQEELITQGSGEAQTERRLRMDDSIRGYLLYSSVFIFPGVFLCLGVFIYFLRRA